MSLLDSQTLSLALGKRHNKPAQVFTSFSRPNPPLRAELLGVGKEVRVHVDEVVGLADCGLLGSAFFVRQGFASALYAIKGWGGSQLYTHPSGNNPIFVEQRLVRGNASQTCGHAVAQTETLIDDAHLVRRK